MTWRNQAGPGLEASSVSISGSSTVSEGVMQAAKGQQQLVQLPNAKPMNNKTDPITAIYLNWYKREVFI